MLLPAEAHPAADDAPDPRRELVKQLLEYRRFKDAAAALEERAEAQGARVPRQEPPEPAAPAAPAVRPVELWDLVSAFARLMRETQALQPATIAVDDTPQHVHEARVAERVRAAGRVRFADVFDPPFTRPRLIGTFLAVLELVRHHGIGLDQPEPDGDIWLVAAGEPTDPHDEQPASSHEGPPCPTPPVTSSASPTAPPAG
jgi:segregation and condensation protein A